MVAKGGSFALVQSAMIAAGADTRECTVGSLVGGRWLLYIGGAPAAVNGEWTRQYRLVPDGIALWSRCP